MPYYPRRNNQSTNQDGDYTTITIVVAIIGLVLTFAFGFLGFSGQIASKEWRLYWGLEKTIPNKPPEDEKKIFHPPGEKVDQLADPQTASCYGCDGNSLFWIEWIRTTAEETTISLAIKRVQQDNKANCNLSTNSQQLNDNKGVPIYFTDDTGNAYNITKVFMTDDENPTGIYHTGVVTISIKDRIKNIRQDEIIRVTLIFPPLQYNTAFVVFHSPWIERCQLALESEKKN